MSTLAQAWDTKISDKGIERMIEAAHQARSAYISKAIRGWFDKMRTPRQEPKVARPGTTWSGLPRLMLHFTSNGAPDGLFSGR